MCGRVCFLVGEQSRISRLSQISHMLITQMKSRPGRSIWLDSSPVSACSKGSYFLFFSFPVFFPARVFASFYVTFCHLLFFFFFFLILQFRWPVRDWESRWRRMSWGSAFRGNKPHTGKLDTNIIQQSSITPSVQSLASVEARQTFGTV